MTLLKPQTGNIPRPFAGAFSQPYWDGCARGELLFQRCTACNGITEFEDERVEQIQDEIAERYGFRLRSHKHELYGICAACQASK